MPRHKLFFLFLLPALLIAGLARMAAAQTAPAAEVFEPVRTIGQDRPSGLRYDPNFDRFAWVDDAGQLVIVDAPTLAPLHVLYPSGAYAAFSFSRDGTLLAVAIDVRVDVWDVASGIRVASFEPPGARRVQGPLQFTRSDELLVLDSIVPAPQELRRSENDTVIQPWVWDIAAARDLRPSVLVNRVSAYPFYNVRVSLVAGDNGILVSGLDNRIQVYDADTPTMQLIADLPASRLETEPVVAWRSATDPYLYVSLNNSGSLVQIDTATNAVLPFDLGSESLASLGRLRALAFSRAHQPIGDQTNQFNPLAGLLLGSDYSGWTGYQGSVFSLLDVLVPLLDDPLRDATSGTALLAYHFNEANGSGAADAYHPSGINGIALSPDAKTLAFRRQSGPVELYDIASGMLRRILTPGEPDPNGRHTFAFSGDSRTLVVDFERFDAASGERVLRAANYTEPFDSFGFDAAGHLITFGGSPLAGASSDALIWRLWDVESGNLLREASFAISGDTILAVSDDQLRYLTQTLRDDGGADLRIIDGWAGETQTFPLPTLANDSISQIVPNADWTRFLIVYTSGTLAAYARDGAQLYFDAGNNLPANAFDYRWQDERTIAVRSYAGMTSAPLLDIQYHASGLPQCIVDALPETWTALIPAWERLVYQNQPRRVNDIARQLCTALTGAGAQNVHAAEGTPTLAADAAVVADWLLTPSPTVEYRSARTPAPIAVPGVPTCITSRYRSEAAAYAELWRQVTAGITDPAQLEQINTMICEGLLGDLGFVRPTPTVNPNALSITTPTPLPAGPETTGGDELGYNVLTIDVETGLRAFASAVVATPETPQPDIVARLNTDFRSQYRVYPYNPVVSPDGRLMAAQDSSGFVTIYRLSRPVADLLVEEADAQATRAAQAPRSIGLALTATQPPQALGTPLPTLTPTVTLTPIPLTAAEAALPQWGETQVVCPARTLARLPDLPADFTPPGTLIVRPVVGDDGSFLWTLNPRTGALVGDVSRPQCGLTEYCSLSPDGAWLVRQNGSVIVSHPDGSAAVTLYSQTDADLLSPAFSWREPHTLMIDYYGVLPTLSPEQRPLIGSYDPETQTLIGGMLAPTVVPLGLLPFDVLARQPYGTLELLAEQFAGGTRYYLRDTVTGATQVFGQNLAGWSWQPAGHYLYYQQDDYSYQYDTQTGEHTRLGKLALPSGIWAPDGQQLVSWLYPSDEETTQALLRGELPALLSVWNSETGLTTRYCLPELTGSSVAAGGLTWSPDSRYLAFAVYLSVTGDVTPTPTYAISPEAPPATATPIPLDVQYAYRNPRTVILDTVTGNVAIVSVEVNSITEWAGE